MTDCLSCKHAEPARAPDGSIDFRPSYGVKNCKRLPPTPVALMGPGGELKLSAFFPVVGAGVRCNEHAERPSAVCCSSYSSLIQNGSCRDCGFPKAAHDMLRKPHVGDVCQTCRAEWCRPLDAPGKLRRIHTKPLCRGVGLAAVEEVDA